VCKAELTIGPPEAEKLTIETNAKTILTLVRPGIVFCSSFQKNSLKNQGENVKQIAPAAKSTVLEKADGYSIILEGAL
jgi:hypothetical protein